MVANGAPLLRARSYYSHDRQYGGADSESLSRARNTFANFCDAFQVPRPLRATCLPCALRNTEHYLPSLVHDSRGLPEDALWDLIHSRVHSAARTLRIREQ